MPEVHLERLLGRRVEDVHGRSVGHIEEVVAERRNGVCTVREFHLGPSALLERLAMSASAVPFLGFLARFGGGCRVPWDRLDLSDPERLRLTCDADALAPLSRSS
jgi:hypothetical protein